MKATVNQLKQYKYCMCMCVISISIYFLNVFDDVRIHSQHKLRLQKDQSSKINFSLRQTSSWHNIDDTWTTSPSIPRGDITWSTMAASRVLSNAARLGSGIGSSHRFIRTLQYRGISSCVDRKSDDRQCHSCYCHGFCLRWIRSWWQRAQHIDTCKQQGKGNLTLMCF